MKFTCLCILILSLLECLYAHSPTSGKGSRGWKPKVKSALPHSLVKPLVETAKSKLPHLHQKGITKHPELENPNSTPNMPPTTTTEIVISKDAATKEDSSVSFYQYNVFVHCVFTLPTMPLAWLFDFSFLFPPVYDYDIVKYCRAKHLEYLITSLQLSGYILPAFVFFILPETRFPKKYAFLIQCFVDPIIYYFCPNLFFYAFYYINLCLPVVMCVVIVGALLMIGFLISEAPPVSKPKIK
jgi:hypothetical protein